MKDELELLMAEFENELKWRHLAATDTATPTSIMLATLNAWVEACNRVREMRAGGILP